MFWRLTAMRQGRKKEEIQNVVKIVHIRHSFVDLRSAACRLAKRLDA
jgi:hypothetical protein